jgi:hypothetical protein
MEGELKEHILVPFPPLLSFGEEDIFIHHACLFSFSYHVFSGLDFSTKLPTRVSLCVLSLPTASAFYEGFKREDICLAIDAYVYSILTFLVTLFFQGVSRWGLLFLSYVHLCIFETAAPDAALEK